MNAESYLQALDVTSSRLSDETRALLHAENEVVTEGFKLLNSVFHALCAYSEDDGASDDLLKSARTTTALRISKTLQAAFVLQERDMTAESLSLCRDALEAAFAWKYLEMNPKSVRHWFNAAWQREDEFSFARIVGATGDRARVYELYSLLCKFCHPTGMTFSVGVSIEPSNYSMGWRKLCCGCILVVTRRYIEAVLSMYGGHLFHTDVPALVWQERARVTAVRLFDGFSEDFKEAQRAYLTAVS